MYRLSGDSINSMSHPIRRAYGPQQPPQLSLDDSIEVEEQCMRDDLYFNLLYKSFDTSAHGITHRINHLASTENATDRPISAELERIDKAWRSSLLDYRQMDSELARIQREYEAIESNLTRYRNADKRSSPDLNLVGSALATIARSSAGERDNRRANSPPSTLSSDLNVRCQHSGALTEIPSSYQLPTVAELLAARNSRNTAVAAPKPKPMPMPTATATAPPPTVTPPPPPPPPLPLPQPEQCQRESATVEQPVRSQMDSVRAPEPYRCPVCWNCVRQRKPVSTTCGHVFCNNCIRTALRTTCKCPVCQRLMTTRQIFRIYI
ncbi:hypothetical protein KR093_004840 [Drosophila rubida]|uniref:RING-type domain-containing protein n=1 Tax=Drosophila rubida TaxID=30044 RepID=A0AAD4JZC7_9MUSC|nr:hypothetical protein KR093_004840 [Drosophila rubida]